MVLIFTTLKQRNCSNNVKCRILFLIYPTTGSILFFWERESERESANISWRQENENDNPARKWYICSSIITLIFGLVMTLGRHSGFKHVSGETGTTLQKGCFYVVFSQGNSGHKVLT